ncbi:MAG: sigma-70 family RNA polymerase sigma factor [Phycisphaerales bacterium]|nr:sigma-70 family RNA polymerase sigma factor [Phycisphaerales bacterium]
MDPTRSTLLVRLRNPADQQAWQTFDVLYRGMLIGYARARGLTRADAEDVAQQCSQAVLEQIAQYAHQGSFSRWLRAIAHHKIADLARRRHEVRLPSGEWRAQPDDTPAADKVWDRHWAEAHLRYCAEAARAEVADSTYAAFVGTALDGRSAEAVGAALGMSVNQVYVSKHRVLERIRAKMLDLTGEDFTREGESA